MAPSGCLQRCRSNPFDLCDGGLGTLLTTRNLQQDELAHMMAQPIGCQDFMTGLILITSHRDLSATPVL